MTSDSGDKFAAARGGSIALSSLSPRRGNKKRSEDALRSTARTVIVAIVVLSAVSYVLVSLLGPRRSAHPAMHDHRGGIGTEEGYVENVGGGVIGPTMDDWDYGPDGSPLMQYPKFHHANYKDGKTAGGGDNDKESIGAAKVNAGATSGTTPSSSPLPASYLTNSSVVLVTGAAGFIGSELVMALHRTYGPKRILCVDSLDSAFAGSGGGPFSAAASAGGATSASEMGAKLDLEARSRTEDDLALLEYRRQRLFHVLQAVPTARFYKVDFRPSIPEYFDVGEVPVLDSIFERNPDISHVVHMADGHRAGADVEEQAVPRVREQTKTGMMEALLEQIRKEMGKRKSRASEGGDGGGNPAPIQFVFASSSGVYDPTRPPERKREVDPITAPGSLHGTSKVIDEVLAATYGSIHGIRSVSLRFFGVYGPWGPPGSPLFEMAERAVGDADAPVLTLPRHEEAAGEGEDAKKARDDRRKRMGKAYYLGGRSLQSMSDHPAPTDGTDLIYIDDAVDAVMSAMQLPLGSSDGDGGGDKEKSHFSSPLVFNVGSGEATTLVHAAEMMEKYFPRTVPESAVSAQREDYRPEEEPVTMYADTSRSAALLNWRPRTDLSEGIVQLLSWHYDRAFPYGPPPPSSEEDDANGVGNDGSTSGSTPASYNEEIASRGVAGCSPFDPECLRGAAVFPCSSECANPGMCVPGPYDAASLESRRVTAGCEAVLYTVALGVDVRPSDLAGASVAASPETVHHVEAPPAVAASGREVSCNVAFVTEGSEVWRVAVEEAAARRAAREAEGGVEGDATGGGATQKTTVAEVGTAVGPMHGFWRLVALPAPPAPQGDGDASDADAWHREQHRDVLLPKLSPGRFFAPSVRTAIFAEPDLVVSDVPRVLDLFRERPADREGGAAATSGSVGGVEAQTAAAMMASRRVGGPTGGTATYDEGTARRENAYNAIRVALRGELSAGAGGMGLVDPSWLVHAVDAEDARLFRCDVYAEVLQWSGTGPAGGAGSAVAGADAPAFDFVTGLHDLWSRVIAQWAGFRPWWRDDGALVPSEETAEKEVDKAAGTGEGDLDGEELTVAAEEARKLGSDGGNADEKTGNKKKGEEEANAAKDDDGERDEDDEGEAGEMNDAGEDEEDEEEKERAKRARRMARSTWMGVLSSKSTYQFVRVLPPSLGLVVKL